MGGIRQGSPSEKARPEHADGDLYNGNFRLGAGLNPIFIIEK